MNTRNNLKDNSIYKKDRILGCLIGGASGGALGYPVEFMPIERILGCYGRDGITEFSLEDGRTARISDNAQMSMFTASGIISAAKHSECINFDGFCNCIIKKVGAAYVEWMRIQEGSLPYGEKIFEISGHPAFYSRRFPDSTSISALKCIYRNEAVSDSGKGCGGMSRTVPVALIPHDYMVDAIEIASIGGSCAKMTHRDPAGFIPASMLTYIIFRMTEKDTVSKADLSEIVHNCCDILPIFYDREEKETYGRLYPAQVESVRKLTEKALRLSFSGLPDCDATGKLGEGWNADECLAVSIYCSLKYFGNFDAAVRCAVNINGDSDSAGSVTGNITGMVSGYGNIPRKYLDNLEALDVMEDIGTSLYML